MKNRLVLSVLPPPLPKNDPNDTYHAITSDRPYRKGRSFAEARDEIARCSGKQFDPEIVKRATKESFVKLNPMLVRP